MDAIRRVCMAQGSQDNCIVVPRTLRWIVDPSEYCTCVAGTWSYVHYYPCAAAANRFHCAVDLSRKAETPTEQYERCLRGVGIDIINRETISFGVSQQKSQTPPVEAAAFQIKLRRLVCLAKCVPMMIVIAAGWRKMMVIELIQNDIIMMMGFGVKFLGFDAAAAWVTVIWSSSEQWASR